MKNPGKVRARTCSTDSPGRSEALCFIDTAKSPSTVPQVRAWTFPGFSGHLALCHLSRNTLLVNFCLFVPSPVGLIYFLHDNGLPDTCMPKRNSQGPKRKRFFFTQSSRQCQTQVIKVAMHNNMDLQQKSSLSSSNRFIELFDLETQAFLGIRSSFLNF